MNDIVELVGPNQALAIFGVTLVGANAENAKKFLFTILFIVLVLLAMKGLRALVRGTLYRTGRERVEFWSRQGLNLFSAVLLVFGVTSIWFDDPTRLTTAMGLVTAGLAFALQKVITAMAGYIVILRGDTFNVGDRIVMGGVRGDVIALAFTQTTILEMGQPPPVQKDEPAMWVRSRQYTGRVVTVSNARIFDEPVFNYTRDFPYLWEELQLPIWFRLATRRTNSPRSGTCAQCAARRAKSSRSSGDASALYHGVARRRATRVRALDRQLDRTHGALYCPRPWCTRAEGPNRPAAAATVGAGRHSDRIDLAADLACRATLPTAGAVVGTMIGMFQTTRS